MTTKTTKQPSRHKITPLSAALKNRLEKASPLPKPRHKITYIPGPLPTEGVVRLPSVLAFLNISKTSFLDGVKAGKFPPGKLLYFTA